MRGHKLSVVRACHIVRFSRAAYYRLPRAAVEKDAEVIAVLNAVVERYPRNGFWKCYRRIRRQGHRWNHKRMHRIYCALGLNLARRTKRRVPQRIRQPLEAPAVLNQVWAVDFMADSLYGGRKIRILNVIDEGNREALAALPAVSIPSTRMIRLLEELIAFYGKPKAFRVDNGPELTAEVFVEWCREQNIEIRYIQPGKPDQNAYIERFNRSYREGVLDAYVFSSIEEVQQISEEWLEDYNETRPHDSLGHEPPLAFLPRTIPPRESSYELST